MEFKNFNTLDEFDIWRKSNNISREKLELFHDFIISLDKQITSTFFGFNIEFDDNDIAGHFTWCWDKVINDFKKENIIFKKTGTHFSYFFSFYQSAFYKKMKENGRTKLYFDYLFDIMGEKTTLHLELLLDIYKYLNVNLKN